MKEHSMAGRLCRADDAACAWVMRALSGRVSGAGMTLLGALALVLGALLAAWLGGAGAGESALCGAVMLLWWAALMRGEARALDALAMLALLTLVYGVRMCLLPVVSPDCQDYLLVWADVMENLSFGEVMARQVGDYTVIYQYIVFLISRIPLDRVVLFKALSFAFEALLAWAAASLVCAARGGGGCCFARRS